MFNAILKRRTIEIPFENDMDCDLFVVISRDKNTMQILSIPEINWSFIRYSSDSYEVEKARMVNSFSMYSASEEDVEDLIAHIHYLVLVDIDDEIQEHYDKLKLIHSETEK